MSAASRGPKSCQTGRHCCVDPQELYSAKVRIAARNPLIIDSWTAQTYCACPDVSAHAYYLGRHSLARHSSRAATQITFKHVYIDPSLSKSRIAEALHDDTDTDGSQGGWDAASAEVETYIVQTSHERRRIFT